MMDAPGMFPEGFHPMEPRKNRQHIGDAKHYTRTQCPPRYYWIDFGLSVKFNESERSPQVLPLQANDRTAPEFQRPGFKKAVYNPFSTDIYYLGNLVRTFVDVSPIYDDQCISEALSIFRVANFMVHDLDSNS